MVNLATSPKRPRRLADALPAFLATVAQHANAAATAQAIANELVEAAGALHAVVYLADSDERTLRLAAFASCDVRGGRPEAPAALDVLDALDHAASDPAVRAARTRLLYLPSDHHVGDRGTRVSVPLLSGERLLGAVTWALTSRLEPREFAIIESLGIVLGALVDRARREEEARARAEWTSIIAHELRQPLHAVMMQSSLITCRDASDARTTSMLARIAGSLERMNRLVGDLTDASLVDLRKLALKRTPTDVVALAERLTDPCEHETPWPVRLEVRGDIPVMSIDPDRIEQVLSNLLTNAKKYGRAGSDIRVTIERRSGDVLVSVTNEGPPIPAEKQARLFDRFYRAHDGSGGKGGLGLGLYVCRGLAEAHGGRITLTSGGDTTTFCLTLPIRTAPVGVRSCRPESQTRLGDRLAIG